MRSATRIVTACLLLGGLAHVSAQEIEPRPADPAPLAHKSLILDVVQFGDRFVAVGERGHVLRSSDGRQWTQARFVPVSSTLVRVTETDGKLWAVGHDSAIIHSYDNGNTWHLQNFEPDLEQPLLDVHFFDEDRGMAIGAYGLLMLTDDGGRHWEMLDIADIVTSEAIDWEEAAEAVEEFADDEMDVDERIGWDEDFYDPETDFDRGCYEFMECHLNGLLVLDDDRLMIAAERGYGYRSTDGGETWESFRFPYPGSMFGLLAVPDGILAYGLRGHVQFSDDFGDTWEMLETGIESTLMGGNIDPEGRPVMVGAGAAILTWDPETREFRISEDRLGSAYAAVLFTPEGKMILAGEDGLKHE